MSVSNVARRFIRGDFKVIRDALVLWLPTLEFHGIRIALRDLPLKTKYQMAYGVYEIQELELLDSLDFSLPLIELGASSGALSCVANSRLSDPAKHVVLEPNPRLRPIIERNQRLNDAKFVHVFGALAYGTATVSFPIHDDPISSSLYLATKEWCEVPTYTLLRLLEAYSFGHCNLICDIEGQEVELIRREADVLASHVDALILEIHPELVGDTAVKTMLGSLSDAGFFEIRRSEQVLAFKNMRQLRKG